MVVLTVELSITRRLGKPTVDERKVKGDTIPSDGPKYLISFCDSASDEVVQYIVKQLEVQGLRCEVASNGSSRYVTVTAQFKVLAKQVGVA